jgi:hypothetical protein
VFVLLMTAGAAWATSCNDACSAVAACATDEVASRYALCVAGCEAARPDPGKRAGVAGAGCDGLSRTAPSWTGMATAASVAPVCPAAKATVYDPQLLELLVGGSWCGTRSVNGVSATTRWSFVGDGTATMSVAVVLPVQVEPVPAVVAEVTTDPPAAVLAPAPPAEIGLSLPQCWRLEDKSFRRSPDGKVYTPVDLKINWAEAGLPALSFGGEALLRCGG